MYARVQQLWAGLAAFLLSQPPARRLAMAVVGTGSLALVLGLAWWVQRPLFRPLFTNLTQDDAAAIVEALRGEKVPFQLEDGGRAVLVPAERLYELRLQLASRGLPEGGGVGFEVFDKQMLGQTDFLEHLNYQRALQGELSRTIAQLAGVESARVHLAIPERSLFIADDRRPSASVVVKLMQGRTLARAQIDGIVHLVSASVEGLAADAVTVVDEGGRMLTQPRGGLEGGGAPSGALEYQQSLEVTIADRIEGMLGAVVGRDKVIARVAASVDFARVERTEEIYDPDRTAIRSQHTTKEQSAGARSTSSTSSTGGTPGAEANLTNDAGANGAEGARSERKEETQSYEVSKVISRTLAPVGAVKQLSVAVLIDGTYKEEKGTRTFVPRPQEELDRLTELVKSAVGFSSERGDKIQVSSVPFQIEALPPAEGIGSTVGRWAPAIGTRLLGVAFAALMLLYVVRPLVTTLAVRAVPPPPLDPQQLVAQLTQENLQLTQQNPERAAQLVREWLVDGGSPP